MLDRRQVVRTLFSACLALVSAATLAFSALRSAVILSFLIFFASDVVACSCTMRALMAATASFPCGFASASAFLSLVSRAQLAPSRVLAKLRTSPSKPALKPSYSHVVKQGLKTPTCDPGTTHMMESRAPPVLQVSRVTPRDPGKPGDLPRDWSSARPRDVTRFRRATRLLIGTWKTVGQSTVDRRINKVTRLTIVTHVQSAVNAAQH